MTRHDRPGDTGQLLERLLVYLDDGGSADERCQVEAILRQDPAARELLRDLAEQAVTVADCRRVAGEGTWSETPSRAGGATPGRAAGVALAGDRRGARRGSGGRGGVFRAAGRATGHRAGGKGRRGNAVVHGSGADRGGDRGGGDGGAW